MHPTTSTTNELKQKLQESMSLLKTLRDEIRVELHLAGMEAKEHWKKLEHRFAEAERIARDTTHASKQAVEDTLQSFSAFKTSLKGERPTEKRKETPSERTS